MFVLETSISIRDDEGHKDVDCFGGEDASGYYISQGAVQKITWKKDDEKARLKFYDESGKEIHINRGKSYIVVNYPGQVTVE